MSEAAATFAEAGVVGLIVKDFARLPVADQARLKEQLQHAAGRAITPLAAAERIVLEAPGSIALIVLGGPEQALDAAERAQALSGDLPLCIALNHGPVKLVVEAGRAAEFMGDGIVEAITLAQLATRGKVLVSRSFREALEREAPHRARLISPLGSFTDDNVRKHEIFALDPQSLAARRRRFIVMAALVMVAGIGAGLAGRMAFKGAQRPAVILFDVKPRGEIFVDGQPKGTTPPISSLQVAPGRRSIEVRHESYPPLKLQIDLKPAEEIRVTHAFASAKGERRLIDDVRRRLGL